MATELLDSGVLALALRGNAGALDRIPVGAEDPPCVSVVTRTEILAGMRPHEEVRTIELLSALSSLAAGPSIADRAGRQVYSMGRPFWSWSASFTRPSRPSVARNWMPPLATKGNQPPQPHSPPPASRTERRNPSSIRS